MGIKLYTGPIEQFMRDPLTKEKRDIHSVRIWESDSSESNYYLIDELPVTPIQEFVETENASPDLLNHWYKLEFISDPLAKDFKSYGMSNPILPEIIDNIVCDVREAIGDTSTDAPAWTDKEYLTKIRFALMQARGEKNMSAVSPEYVPLITLMVQELFAMDLSFYYSKYYDLQTPAVTLQPNQIASHYRQHATELRSMIQELMRRLNMGGGAYDRRGIISQMPGPNIVDAQRFSVTDGVWKSGRKMGRSGPPRIDLDAAL